MRKAIKQAIEGLRIKTEKQQDVIDKLVDENVELKKRVGVLEEGFRKIVTDTKEESKQTYFDELFQEIMTGKETGNETTNKR